MRMGEVMEGWILPEEFQAALGQILGRENIKEQVHHKTTFPRLNKNAHCKCTLDGSSLHEN